MTPAERNAVLEEAISAAWNVEVRIDALLGRMTFHFGTSGYSNPLDAVEAAIRALKEQEPTT